MTERAGQGARWPAVSRQRVNPAHRGPLTPWSVTSPKASRELLYSIPTALCEEIASAATAELADRLSIPD